MMHLPALARLVRSALLPGQQRTMHISVVAVPRCALPASIILLL